MDLRTRELVSKMIFNELFYSNKKFSDLNNPYFYTEFSKKLSKREDMEFIYSINDLAIKKLTLKARQVFKKNQIAKDNILTVSHISTSVLNDLLLSTPQIIARAGYSTIMDLHKLGRTAQLYPTPGQWEQEYLASLVKQQL